MDRPIHLDASTLEQSAAFAYAARNTLRRTPTIIEIGEATDPVLIELAKKAGAEAAARARKGN